jgi:hypothetical protein
MMTLHTLWSGFDQQNATRGEPFIRLNLLFDSTGGGLQNCRRQIDIAPAAAHILIWHLLKKDPDNRCIPGFQDLLWGQIEVPPS